MAVIVALVATMMLQPALALLPPASCVTAANSWCNAVRDDTKERLNCDADAAGTDLVALYDTNAEHNAPTWRCYAQSTLDPTHTKYVSGTSYCSRPQQLNDTIRNCLAGVQTGLQPVFQNGETDIVTNTTYPCIRIPAITRLAEGTLVAFAECRHWVGDGCEPVGVAAPRLEFADWRDACMKSSTDGGKTWGPLRTIANCSTQPSPVVVPPPAGQQGKPGRLILQGNNCGASQTAPNANTQMYSDDGGATWSDRVRLLPQIGADVDGSFTGPGIGIRLSDSHPVAPGRLLFIGHRGAYVHDFVWYSDDGGSTYRVANTSYFDGMDEAQLVEVPAALADSLGYPAGTVLANMRNNHLNKTCDCRAVAFSTDGGASFSPVTYDAALISPVCQATIVSGPAPPSSGSSGDALYFANPASTSAREAGTVRMSTTAGASWSSDLLIASAGYAYSCLLPPASSSDPLGLLWETQGNSATCIGPSCRVMMSLIPLTAL